MTINPICGIIILSNEGETKNMPVENRLNTTYIVVKYSSIEGCEIYLKHPCDKVSELVSRWTKDIDKAFCFGDAEIAFITCDKFEGTGVRKITI